MAGMKVESLGHCDSRARLALSDLRYSKESCVIECLAAFVWAVNDALRKSATR